MYAYYFRSSRRELPIVGALIRNRRFRERIRALPQLDTTRLVNRREQELALVYLTVFANRYVWGGPEPDTHIPAALAVPFCALADELGRPPIVHYASMQLYNWRRIDPSLPVCADNVEMIVQFLGGVDEAWLFVAALDVELLGAPLLVGAYNAVLHAERGDHVALTADLADIAAGMPAVNAALDRQREWVDPHAFFHRVRPFAAGWPAPGAIYEKSSATRSQ